MCCFDNLAHEIFLALYNYIDDVLLVCSYENSPALDHEFIHGLGTAGGRGEAVTMVHELHCLW